MKTVIEMAREVYGVHTEWTGAPLERLTQFAELVRADERWEQSKRRGVLAFCPYTGRPRHPSDIASDPHGILILVPDQPIRASRSKNEDRN
jgi:hypothetical protein